MLSFAVGDPAGSCCSLFSPCGSGSRGLRIPDADAVPGVGGAVAGSYQQFCHNIHQLEVDELGSSTCTCNDRISWDYCGGT